MTSLAARALLVLILTIFAGAAALAYSNSQPKKYSADMRLEFGRLVTPDIQLLGGGFSEPQMDENIRIQTEAQEVRSFDVAEAAAKAHPDLGSANAIAGAINVAAIRDTLTVIISAQASSPHRAARVASAYGDAYLALHQALVRKHAAATERALQIRYNEMTQGDKANVPGANIRFQMNTLDVLRRLGSGQPQTIERARATNITSSPNTARDVGFGILFGLVVGIGLVALRSESPARAAAAAARRAAERARQTTRSR